MVLTVHSPPLSRRFGVKTRLLDAVFRNLDSIAELDVTGCGHTARQTVDVDEAVGRLLIEAVAGIVGGQIVVIQRGVGTTTGHDGASAMQDHADFAGNVLLGVFDEGVQGLRCRGEPLRIVDEFGPALVDIALDAVLLAFEAAVLEFLVGGDQCDSTRSLVQLTGLDADQTEAAIKATMKMLNLLEE